jgi:hypothetical protein
MNIHSCARCTPAGRARSPAGSVRKRRGRPRRKRNTPIALGEPVGFLAVPRAHTTTGPSRGVEAPFPPPGRRPGAPPPEFKRDSQRRRPRLPEPEPQELPHARPGELRERHTRQGLRPVDRKQVRVRQRPRGRPSTPARAPRTSTWPSPRSRAPPASLIHPRPGRTPESRVAARPATLTHGTRLLREKRGACARARAVTDAGRPTPSARPRGPRPRRPAAGAALAFKAREARTQKVAPAGAAGAPCSRRQPRHHSS